MALTGSNTEETRIALSQAGPIPNAVLYNNGKDLWNALIAANNELGNIVYQNTPYLDFDTVTPGASGIGQIAWNDTDGTLEFGLKGGNVTLQIGQEQVSLVKHADNTGLTVGKVVYFVGSDGSNKTVRYAQANAEATSSKTFGLMAESATGGNKAFCATFGLVRNIDTSSLTEGAVVYLSPSVAGGMTTTKPVAPDHAVMVGFCIRSSATVGSVFVSVNNGYELDELHNVKITSVANDDVLKYDAAQGLWVNGTGGGAGVPVGTIIQTGQNVVPPGFLDCDGSSQLRSAYPDLFAAIGTTFGQGAVPGTTFALPTVVGTYGNFVICADVAGVVVETQSLIGAPIGTLQLYAGSVYPTGWLRADGTAIGRATYADLFAIIGTTYGAGDGSTTFNLPNLPSSGTGSPVYIIKAVLSGSVEPSTVAHAGSHIRGGADVIDGDRAQVDFVPTYYTRNSAAPGAGANTDLAAHLSGIDTLAGVHASRHIRGGADIIDADRAQIDYVPTYYTRNSGASGAGAVTDLTAHLAGIDTKLYNNIVAFSGERNGAPGVGNFYANGNGAADTFLTFPFACELIGASFRQNAAANGSITIQIFKNGAVNASYQLTSSGSNGNASADWRSSPLAFAAGDSLAWRVSAVTSTAGGSVVTWFMRITAF